MTTEQYRTRSGLSIFLSFFRPHRGLFFLDLACALVVALIDLAYPIVSRYAMRTLLPQNAYRAFFTVMLVVVAAYALRALLYFVITYWGHTFGIRVEADIRRDLFRHMQSLGYEFYDHNRTGEDNGDAHLKRSVMGREVVVAVTAGALDLGPWEQIFYGEFDGLRRKRVLIKIIGDE